MMKMKVLLCTVIVCCLIPAGWMQAQTSPAAKVDGPSARPGVLLLAHGGSATGWNEEVRHVADQVDLTIPTEVAFGMATRSTMQAAIDRLKARGVTEIVAVPLFVSSHSSVIDSTAYLLSLRKEKPEDLTMFASMDHGGSIAMNHSTMAHDPAMSAEAEKPIVTSVPVHMAAALNHHPAVAEILKDRAASISRDPADEVVLLIAHGPVPDDENKLWLNDMGLLAEQIRKQTHYARIEYLTLRDDADEPVRKAATQQLREEVEQFTKEGKTVLIVPLLLSYGGIEDGLRKRLSGLSYKMPTQALLPDKRIVSWVIDTANSEIHPSAVTAVQR
jgi:hypothetical protein